MIIILSYFLLCAVHLMQGFIYEKMLQGNYKYSQDRSFLTGNEENPALELSNVHNRTSARDGPMFGYKGLSMYTTSLVQLLNRPCGGLSKINHPLVPSPPPLNCRAIK
jgi:hypothetical protein